MILTVCTSPELLSVMIIVKKVISLLQIIAPICLIIFAGFDIIKAVVSTDQDAINKKLKRIPGRIMAVIIVFFVPVIIDLLMSLVDSTFEYASCFENATEQYVVAAYESRAEVLVTEAENKLNRLAYNDAMMATNKVKNETLKAGYKERLAKVLESILAKEEADNNSNDDGNNNDGGSGPIADQGSNIYYNQGSYASVAFCSGSKTLKSSGCGAVSFAMVATNLVSTTYNPTYVAAWLCNEGGHGGGGLSGSYFTNTAMLNKFKLKSTKLFGSDGSSANDMSNINDANKNKIITALKKGQKIILYIPGHYVELNSIDANGYIQLNDPGKRANTGKHTMDELVNLTKNNSNRCSDSNNCGWHGAWAFWKA